MKCLSCGANLSPLSSERYLKCEYCGSYSPNKSFVISSLRQVTNNTNNNTSKNKDNFDDLLLHENYSVLKEKSLNHIKDFPSDWEPYLYLAISNFWLGSKDFKHLGSVFDNFFKSLEISNNEQINNYINIYANSAVSLASKNKNYGIELIDSLETFNYVDTLKTELTNDVKSQREKYCKIAIEQLAEMIDKGLMQKKDNFDVPYNKIKNFYFLLKYVNNKDFLEKFYLFGKLHLEKHKLKSYYSELKEFINVTEEKLYIIKSQVVGKQITFNAFGKLKIK